MMENGNHSQSERRKRSEQDIERALQARKESGEQLHPIRVSREKKRKLSGTPWASAWQRALAECTSYEGRLVKGRTLLRKDAIHSFHVREGEIDGLVADERLHETRILAPTADSSEVETWRSLCQGKVGALIELLQGKIGDELMASLMQPGQGMIPEWGKIRGACDCLDDADICSHAAALLYGLGVAMEEDPKLFFRWRGVDPELMLSVNPQDLIASENPSNSLNPKDFQKDLVGENLENLFGIDLE